MLFNVKFPRLFYSLLSVDLGWMISYYGMKAILLLYMIYSITNGGLGIEEHQAASILSIYGSLTFMLGIIGSYISDRLLGPYYATLYGSIVIVSGHITLSIVSGMTGLFLGLSLILIGTGMTKGTSVMLGQKIGGNNSKRDSVFSLFYLGANVGAFISPFLTGSFVENGNFHYGFAVSAITMFLGLLIFIFTNKRHFHEKAFAPFDKVKKEEIKPLVGKVILFLIVVFLILISMNLFNLFNINNIILIISVIVSSMPIYLFYNILSSKKITKKEYSKVVTFIPLFISATIFWVLAEQVPTVFMLFAKNSIDISGGQLSWIQSLNPLFIVIFTPILLSIWNKLDKNQPSAPKKFFYGLLIAGSGFIILTLPQLIFNQSYNISIVYIIFSILFLAIAELLISPIGQSTSYALAPQLFKTRMLVLFSLANATAQAINSQIVNFFNIAHSTNYFILVGSIPILFGIILFLFIPKIEKAIND